MLPLALPVYAKRPVGDTATQHAAPWRTGSEAVVSESKPASRRY